MTKNLAKIIRSRPFLFVLLAFFYAQKAALAQTNDGFVNGYIEKNDDEIFSRSNKTYKIGDKLVDSKNVSAHTSHISLLQDGINLEIVQALVAIEQYRLVEHDFKRGDKAQKIDEFQKDYTCLPSDQKKAQQGDVSGGAKDCLERLKRLAIDAAIRTRASIVEYNEGTYNLARNKDQISVVSNASTANGGSSNTQKDTNLKDLYTISRPAPTAQAKTPMQAAAMSLAVPRTITLDFSKEEGQKSVQKIGSSIASDSKKQDSVFKSIKNEKVDLQSKDNNSAELSVLDNQGGENKVLTETFEKAQKKNNWAQKTQQDQKEFSDVLTKTLGNLKGQNKIQYGSDTTSQKAFEKVMDNILLKASVQQLGKTESFIVKNPQLNQPQNINKFKIDVNLIPTAEDIKNKKVGLFTDEDLIEKINE